MATAQSSTINNSLVQYTERACILSLNYLKGGVWVGSIGGAVVWTALKVFNITAASFLAYCSFGAICGVVLCEMFVVNEIFTINNNPARIKDNKNFYERIAVGTISSLAATAFSFVVGGVALEIIGMTHACVFVINGMFFQKRAISTPAVASFPIVLGVAISILTNLIRPMFSPYLLVLEIVVQVGYALKMCVLRHENLIAGNTTPVIVDKDYSYSDPEMVK